MPLPPIIPVDFPDYYDLIVTYQNDDNPAVKWRNTYTFYSATTPVLGVGIVGALATYAVGLIHSDASAVLFDVYNWTRGRQPYPTGSPIISYAASDSGTADTYWTHLHTPYVPQSGETVLRIDHEPEGPGKPGRSFLRGLLGEADVSAVSGGPPILTVTTANLQTDLDALFAAAGMTAYLGAGSGGQHLALVRYSRLHNEVLGSSGVDDFHVIEATSNKLRRKNAR
jgi:hypothetical protein